MSIERQGKCLRCGKCCKSFIILHGALSDFKRAHKKYGLKLIINPDKKTFRCNMLTKNNHCKIHKDKPNACNEAPRRSFPWKCGYKFKAIDTGKLDRKETKKSLDFFYQLPKIEPDEQTKEILEAIRCP